jgi:hypothetical protein
MLGSTITGVVTFAVGLAILWYGLSLIRRSFVLSLLVLAGGCATVSLSALSVTMLDVSAFRGEEALRYMILPASVFMGACLSKFGPHSASDTTERRALRSAIFALVIALFVGTSPQPTQGIVGVFPLLLFWLPLLKYRPASGWRMTIRKAAYSSLVLYAIAAYLSLHSAIACGKRGCFWIVWLPLVYTLRLPHPFDYYAGQLVKYVTIFSFLLTVACSLACLCIWLFDRFRVKALPTTSPLSR